METKKKWSPLALRIVPLYISSYVLMYVIYTMFSTYLNMAGYSNARIASTLSIVSIASYFFTPIAGQFVDSGKCRPTIIVVYLCMLVSSVAFYVAPVKTRFLVLLYAVLACCMTGTASFVQDSWVVKLIQQDGSFAFATVRAFGSLSYAFAGLFYGYLFNHFRFTAGLVIVPVFIAIQIVCYCLIPEPAGNTDNQKKKSMGEHFRILKNPAFLLFTLTIAFGGCLIGVCDSYIPVLVLELGGNTSITGVSIFVLAGTEFVFGLLYKKLYGKLKVSTALSLGVAGFAIKLFVTSLLKNPYLIIVAMLTQAISFCLYMPSRMRYIEENIDSDDVGTALSILTLAQSLASVVVVNPLVGTFSNQFGTAGMMRVFALFAILIGGTFFVGNHFLQSKKAA